MTNEAHNPKPRTVDQVKQSLCAAMKKGTDRAFAQLMLKHGRLTVEARAFVQAWVAA